MSMQGKTALVTGASRGIGRATAKALAAAGAHVIVHYGARNVDAERVVAEIEAAGGSADVAGGDLAASNAAEALAAKIANLTGGRLDMVVANAGTARAVPIDAPNPDYFDQVFAVNVRSPYLLVQKLLPMLRSSANIIFVSSLAVRATTGAPMSAYAASKGAIETLVRHLASELGPIGIRVNAVAPGVIATDLTGHLAAESMQKAALAMQALQRIGKPEDVADVIAFLASTPPVGSTARPFPWMAVQSSSRVELNYHRCYYSDQKPALKAKAYRPWAPRRSFHSQRAWRVRLVRSAPHLL